MASNYLRYMLLTEGSSDRGLMPILDWLLVTHGKVPFRGQWADYIPHGQLATRVNHALKLYPCELLFIHLDAHSVGLAGRKAEVQDCAMGLNVSCVAVVPVRMKIGRASCRERV